LETREIGLESLPGFLDLLNQSSSPDDIVQSLTHGPLRQFNAIAAFLATFDGSVIRLIGSYGYPPEIPTRYEIMAAEHDWPINRAASLNEIVTVTFSNFFIEYPSVEIDRAIWEPFFAAARNDGLIAFIPLANRGLVRGVYGFAAVDPEDMSLADSNLIRGLSAAIGLWLQGVEHGRSTDNANHFTQEIPLILTERQQRILMLVEDGKSNSAISRMLDYSISTVKLDLNRAMRMLRTQDRSTAAARARALQLLPNLDGDSDPKRR
jgi:DNA-binding CsgD family transcriptional regulator